MTKPEKLKPTFSRLPSIFSIFRGLTVTDALFFNEIDGRLSPMPVLRHGIRGTQNVNEVTGTGRDPNNVQVTESAKTDTNAQAVVVKFGMHSKSVMDLIAACSKDAAITDAPAKSVADYGVVLRDFIERAADAKAIDELAHRYARNVLNGRWLWRNRDAQDLQELTIVVKSNGVVVADVTAFDIPLNTFGDYSEAEQDVARILAEGFKGALTSSLEVTARLVHRSQGVQEVYPSQNLLMGKPKGFARSLYKVGEPMDPPTDNDLRRLGQAALRDQKVANALRTFDTWYAAFNPDFPRPISVEPNGANIGVGEFFRADKTSAFVMLKNIANTDPTSAEGLFVLATIIRGGVFSESKSAADKPAKDGKKDEKKEGADAPAAESSADTPVADSQEPAVV